MKRNSHPDPLRAQVQTMRQIWQELLKVQGPLSAALPADLARARAKSGAHESEHARGVGDYHLHAFFRLAAVFGQYQRPLTMGEISDALRVPLSSATRMVDVLVEQGYAERLPDPQDRRVVRVAPTATGRQMYELFQQFFNERMYEFLTHFSPTERKQLLKLFAKAITVLREMNG